jgi:hypothetical protein
MPYPLTGAKAPKWARALKPWRIWILPTFAAFVLVRLMGPGPIKDLPKWMTSLPMEELILWFGCLITLLIILVGLYFWLSGRRLETQYRQGMHAKIKKAYELEPEGKNVHRIR